MKRNCSGKALREVAHDNLILDRYEPLGTAGVGGFGTVRIAWDPRIQRKVAIKTIHLTELDAYRAKLPGARAAEGPAPVSAAEQWHGALPWEDEPANEELPEVEGEPSEPDEEAVDSSDGGSVLAGLRDKLGRRDRDAEGGSEEPDGEDAEAPRPDPVTSLAHLPGLDEARTAAMLDDPRIVTVYDFEVRDRTAYLIMEYVEGITLTRLLSDYADGITLDMVTAVFDAVAGALVTAHETGVLHLDIKPDNIIISPQGQAKVTDFGLATLADASGVGTTGGGTIGYMPLEQMRREHLDARTDEWSLAALTYEMLTGSNPFRARDLEEAESAIVNAELILPSLCWRDVDEQIDDVVFYALDPNRDERYASVADFAEEMDKFLGDAERGREDLAYAVSDALGLLEEEPVEEEYDEVEAAAPKRRALKLGAGTVLTGAFPGLFSEPQASAMRDDAIEFDDEDDYYDEEPYGDAGRDPRARRERGPHVPIAARCSERTTNILARTFAAVASAAIALLAAINMPLLDMLGSTGRPVAVAVIAVLCAVAALVRPHIGAFASYCLLALSFIACGNPIGTAIVIVAVAAWWYTVGHEGAAAANVALLAPVLGAIGGASAVPIVAGACLKPLQALATTALAALMALMMASLGTGDLAGWDALAHWDFAGTDMASYLVALVMKPSTWATIGSWLAAAALFALLRTRDNRALTVLGAVLAAALVIAVSMAFAPLAPQVVISAVAAALAVLVVVM